MIKLSFSTLGCPGWSFDDIISTAKDLGYDGIEFRGLQRQMHMPLAPPFLPENIKSTKDRLKKLDLQICCLTSFARLNETFRIESHMVDAKAYIDLATSLGTPFVRVIGDSGPEPTDVPYNQVAQRLTELADYARDTPVTILVETNGTFSNSQTMLKLLKDVNASNVGVLWDINHPFRNYNESAEYTYDLLGDYIKFMHIKDSIITDEGVQYEMIGYGDLPIEQAIALLKKNDFDGWLSLEWLKRWCLSLAEPGIVFPHYINYIKGLI